MREVCAGGLDLAPDRVREESSHVFGLRLDNWGQEKLICREY